MLCFCSGKRYSSKLSLPLQDTVCDLRRYWETEIRRQQVCDLEGYWKIEIILRGKQTTCNPQTRLYI